MKTAIILYGEYSNIYTKNEDYKHADLYIIPYKDMPFEIPSNIYNVQNIIPLDAFHGIHNVHEGNKFNYIRKKLIEISLDLVTDKNYDIIVTASFQTIITKFPREPGIYHASPVVKNSLPYFEVISDKCVRFDNTPKFFVDLSLEKRKLVLSHLYRGKVSDFAYFTPPEKNKYIFMIPSCIRVSENPFNYHTFNRRSSFTATERFLQTERQIESIKNTLGKDSTTIILEGSNLTFSEMDRLSKYSQIVLFTHDERGGYHSNKNPNKSVYEIYVFGKILPLIEFDWVFKFGGRYHFRNDFDIGKYEKEKPVYKVVPGSFTFTGTPIIECVLYSFPYSYKEKYSRMYLEMLKEFNKNKDIGVENLLMKHTRNDYFKIDTLGLLGRDGVYTYDKFI